MIKGLLRNELFKPDRFSDRVDQEQKVCEKAFFFQNKGKKLFGILHLPLNKSDMQSKIGIVMCQPYLIEPLITQRLEIDIARSLAQKGFPVFRFHYRGCGDSEGEFKEATLSSQVSDTLQAIKVFTEQERLESIGLLGIRLGGTVALMAAEIEKQVNFLILCEPILEPKKYFLDLLRAMKFSALASKRKTISTEQMIKDLTVNGSINVLGYPLHKEIFMETESLNLIESIKKFSGKALLIQVSAFSPKIAKSFQSLANQIRGNGGSCEVKAILERMLVWNFILHPPFRSKKITQTIVQWCKEKTNCLINKDSNGSGGNGRFPYAGSAPGNPYISVTERPIFIRSQNNDLFGILHTPDTTIVHEKIVVILLTGASIPRTHRNRMWVTLARQLTDLGLFAFRFDYRGLGESTGLFEGLNLNKLLTQDLANIIDYLTNHINPDKIILVGECFGARTALSMVNFRKFHGLVFLAAPTVDEDGRVIHMASKKNFAHYLNKLKWQRWGTFLNIERLKRNFVFFAARLQNKWKHIEPKSLVSEEFSKQFSTLVNDKIPSLVIYGTEDDYYENMKLLLQGIDFNKRKHIDFFEVQGEKAHGLVVDIQIQQAVITRVLNWIDSRYLATKN